MDFLILDKLILRKGDIQLVTISDKIGVDAWFEIGIMYGGVSANTCRFDTKEERDKVFNDIKQQLRSNTDGNS